MVNIFPQKIKVTIFFIVILCTAYIGISSLYYNELDLVKYPEISISDYDISYRIFNGNFHQISSAIDNSLNFDDLNLPYLYSEIDILELYWSDSISITSENNASNINENSNLIFINDEQKYQSDFFSYVSNLTENSIIVLSTNETETKNVNLTISAFDSSNNIDFQISKIIYFDISELNQKEFRSFQSFGEDLVILSVSNHLSSTILSDNNISWEGFVYIELPSDLRNKIGISFLERKRWNNLISNIHTKIEQSFLGIEELSSLTSIIDKSYPYLFLNFIFRVLVFVIAILLASMAIMKFFDFIYEPANDEIRFRANFGGSKFHFFISKLIFTTIYLVLSSILSAIIVLTFVLSDYGVIDYNKIIVNINILIPQFIQFSLLFFTLILIYYTKLISNMYSSKPINKFFFVILVFCFLVLKIFQVVQFIDFNDTSSQFVMVVSFILFSIFIYALSYFPHITSSNFIISKILPYKTKTAPKYNFAYLSIKSLKNMFTSSFKMLFIIVIIYILILNMGNNFQKALNNEIVFENGGEVYSVSNHPYSIGTINIKSESVDSTFHWIEVNTNDLINDDDPIKQNLRLVGIDTNGSLMAYLNSFQERLGSEFNTGNFMSNLKNDQVYLGSDLSKRYNEYFSLWVNTGNFSKSDLQIGGNINEFPGIVSRSFLSNDDPYTENIVLMSLKYLNQVINSSLFKPKIINRLAFRSSSPELLVKTLSSLNVNAKMSDVDNLIEIELMISKPFLYLAVILSVNVINILLYTYLLSNENMKSIVILTKLYHGNLKSIKINIISYFLFQTLLLSLIIIILNITFLKVIENFVNEQVYYFFTQFLDIGYLLTPVLTVLFFVFLWVKVVLIKIDKIASTYKKEGIVIAYDGGFIIE